MQRTVAIEGAVYYPGDYTITNPKETIHDIIQRAGGIRPPCISRGLFFVRNGEQIKNRFFQNYK